MTLSRLHVIAVTRLARLRMSEVEVRPQHLLHLVVVVVHNRLGQGDKVGLKVAQPSDENVSSCRPVAASPPKVLCHDSGTHSAKITATSTLRRPVGPGTSSFARDPRASIRKPLETRRAPAPFASPSPDSAAILRCWERLRAFTAADFLGLTRPGGGVGSRSFRSRSPARARRAPSPRSGSSGVGRPIADSVDRCASLSATAAATHDTTRFVRASAAYRKTMAVRNSVGVRQGRCPLSPHRRLTKG
jgi:hypothetical protein